MTALALECADAGVAPVLLLRSRTRVPPSLTGRVKSVVRHERGDASVDRVFGELVSAVIGPLPTWLKCHVSPSLVAAPTGVSWWTDDLYIADERYGHLVVSGVDGARPVLPGLDDPLHIHLDRNNLLVANRSASQILLTEIHGGVPSKISTISRAAGRPLAHPNGVHQSHGVSMIADTDNHRALVSEVDPFGDVRPRWRELRGAGRFKFPCGVFADGSHRWVADTFHHRVVAFAPDGSCVAAEGSYGWEPGQFAYPVGLARWHEFLFVADEEATRVQTFTVEDRETGDLALLPLEGGDRLGAPWLTRPFGLSVNAHGTLAVADRTRRCVWTLDLRALFAVPDVEDGR